MEQQKSSTYGTPLLVQARECSPLREEEEERDGAAPPHGAYWRRTLGAGIGAVTVVLFANLALLIFAKTSGNEVDGIASLFTGSCRDMNTFFTWSHLAINILGSILFATGNACMQCLASPSRHDLDIAHAKHQWFDIGAPGPQNLFQIRGIRALLWTLLALTSLQLHLLFNSILFSAPAATDYMAVLVAPSFLTSTGIPQDPPWSNTIDYYIPIPDQVSERLAVISRLQTNAGMLTRLETSDCAAAYLNGQLSDWRNVIMVTDYDVTDDNTILNIFLSYRSADGKVDAIMWSYLSENNTFAGIPTCNGERYLHHIPFAHSDPCYSLGGNIGDRPATVKYCLAEPGESVCQVSMSSGILAAVIGLNVVKLACLIIAAMVLRFEPLITIGDAISSYTRLQDPLLADQALLTAGEVRRGKWRPGRHEPVVAQTPKTLKTGRRRWIQAVSPARRWWSLFMILATLATSIALMAVAGTGNGYYTFQYTWDAQSFGASTTAAVVGGIFQERSIISTILVANLPQLIVSGASLSYNVLLTSMLLGHEWSSYATTPPKRLRVSRPVAHSAQRGTYYLSLPYRYAVPLLIACALLHWSISQGLFLVHVNWYNFEGTRRPSYDIVSLGWSFKAIVTSVAIGALMVVTLLILMFRKLQPGIPVVGSCSLAIAAACHTAPGDEGAALYKVMYGVLKGQADVPDVPKKVGFGSGTLAGLRPGVIYT